MSKHAVSLRALLPALAVVLVGASGPAAGATEQSKPFRVAPPPLPNAPTVVYPGEPPEEVTRNRHGHNELKVRGKVRDKTKTDKKN